MYGLLYLMYFLLTTLDVALLSRAAPRAPKRAVRTTTTPTAMMTKAAVLKCSNL